MQVPRLPHQFPGACSPLLCHLGKPQESWFFHPLLFLPEESGSDRHPYSESLLLLSLRGPPGDKSQDRSPAGLRFHTSTLLPPGGCLRKSTVLCLGETGPCSPDCGQSWPLASIPVSSQTSSDLSLTLGFPFSPDIVASLGHCLPVCWKPPVQHPTLELPPSV